MQKENDIAIKAVCTTLPGATQGNVAVIVETYRNGAEWYRKYSDGVIEQGGYINNLDSNNKLKQNSEMEWDFVIPFTNPSSVCMHLTNIFTGTYSNYRGGLTVAGITTDKFRVYSDGFVNNADTAYWEARGV